MNQMSIATDQTHNIKTKMKWEMKQQTGYLRSQITSVQYLRQIYSV